MAVGPSSDTSSQDDRFKTLVETVGDFVWETDIHGRFTYCSPRVLDFWGYDPQEMLGTTAFDLMPEDDRGPALQFLLSLRQSPAPFRTHARSLNKRGELVSIEVRGVPFFGQDGHLEGFRGVTRDITERKKAEDILRESEARTRALIKHAPTAIFEIDYSGPRFLSINDAMCSLSGYGREELLGMNPGDFLVGDSRELFLQRVKRRLGGEPISDTADFKVKKKDGSIIFVTLDVSFSPGKPNTALIIGHDVTERRKDEEALAQALQRLSAHIENSPLAVIEFDSQFRVIRWSKEAERMFGWTSREMIGRAMSDVKWVFEDDVARVAQAFGGSLTGKAPGRLSINRNYRKDGSVIWCEWYNSWIHDTTGELTSVFSQVLDVTGRKKMEEALRQSEARYRSLFESVNDAFCILEKVDTAPGEPSDYLIMSGNPSYDAIAGYLSPLGRTVRHVFADMPESHFEAFDALLQSGKPVKYESDFLEGRINEIQAFPIPDGTKRHIGVLFHDITDRKKAEDDLKHYARDLEAAYKELESFSYSVSHDLRAPLRKLDGFSEILLQEYADGLDETARDYLNRIGSASQSMSQLIDDMLKLARISRADLHTDRVDLSHLVAEVAADLKAAEPNRRAEFSVEPGVRAVGDRHLIRILLHNLLDNSWKYASSRPETRIEFGTTREDGLMVCFVRDNGIGFNMKYADRLFQPFHRLHATRKYSGSGIGLAIAWRVVQRHGGRIWAEAEEGKGSTFYFTLGQQTADNRVTG